MKAKELFGKEVIDAEAKVVGKIVDMDVDIRQASIQGILLRSGLTGKLLILPEDIDKVGDKIVLKITKDKIGKGQS